MSNKIYLNKDEQIKRTNRKLHEVEAKAKLVEESSEEERLIEFKIRRKYSLSQEICILRKVTLGIYSSNDPLVVEYNNYVVSCIDEARAELNH